MKSFIDEARIKNILSKAYSREEIVKIVDKAKKLEGLSLNEVGALLLCEDKDLIQEMFNTAKEVKEAIYGKRLVLFAPLYLSNICVNDCKYCGFATSNSNLERRRLGFEEIKKEIDALEKQGHKRVLIVAGEDPKVDLGYLKKAIDTIYNTKSHGEIRRININVAPMNVDSFRELSTFGIGTYQSFQETYHKETYEKVHQGPKLNFTEKLYVMDRAMQGGINDVGIGVLFGLYDYKFEVLALLMHTLHLEKEFGVGPHTISVPRIENVHGNEFVKKLKYEVQDEEFKKIVAILRLAVPYTGILLSTREDVKLRDELFKLGVSQISAGSKTTPGAYTSQDDAGQFCLGDNRTSLEVIKSISKQGYYPSFCTACYRLGRTGKDFMDLAKPGLIQKYCLANAILTYKEYIMDYGDYEIVKIGEDLIQKELKDIKDESFRHEVIAKLKKIEKGERDLYF